MTTQNNSNSNEIYTTLSLFLKYNFTESQAVRSLRLLKIFFEQHYFLETMTKTFENSLEKLQQLENVTETDIKFITEAYQHHGSFFTKESFYGLLNDLGNMVYSLPRLVMNVPVRLDYDSTQKIALWLRSNLSDEILISLRVDPLLVAGCSLGWNNHFAEFSFDQRIKAKKQALFSLLPPL